MQAVAFVPEMSHFVVPRGRIFADQLATTSRFAVFPVFRRQLGKEPTGPVFPSMIISCRFCGVSRMAKNLRKANTAAAEGHFYWQFQMSRVTSVPFNFS
jgi:hypothetical protein